MNTIIVLCLLYIVLFKNKTDFELLYKENELIMNSSYSLGKTTPFIGSKSFESIKLWMLLNHLGKNKIGEFVDLRIKNAIRFKEIINEYKYLNVPIEYDILFSVIFIYNKFDEIDKNNILNKKIYEKMLNDDKYYFHGFTLKINDKDVFVLGYMIVEIYL